MTSTERRSRIEQMYGPGCMIECISPSVATERAEELTRASTAGDLGSSNGYFAGMATELLSRYLLAAAILGEDSATILSWARSRGAQPWTALAERDDIVPEGWLSTRETIDSLPAATQAACFATVLSALRLPADG
ncbi:hypothetical protein [Amycolatopsis sp. RTGN1]|uniref:hypothetical protein n=1 Tax=Amycolatopsis ponsaeliensis TaxID=2992142 RepID=UPI00254A4A0F|nr:hypothetical protein [Amycolatopsis sp. RTGN1]